MSLSTALSLVRLALETAPLNAPVLLARYLRLSRLSRSSRQLPIARVPRLSPQGPRPAAASGDIVIPVYNNFADTSALLASLEAEASQFGRIVVVHDRSTDSRVGPLLEAFASKTPNAQLIENDRNRGFVETCNRGLSATTRDVVILNTDIELPRGAIGRLLAILASDASIATVTPFSSTAFGVGFPDLCYSNERPFGASTEDIDRAFKAHAGLAPIEMPRGVGFCMAIARRALDRLGPFSTHFGQGYGEEADFCLRARGAGYRNVAAPDTYVMHKGGESFGGSWQAKARAGQMKLLNLHPAYVDLVQDYLGANEARAVAFSALVRLAGGLAGAAPQLFRDQGSSGSSAGGPRGPRPSVELSGPGGLCSARISYRGQSYDFTFADERVRGETLALAGLSE